MPQLHEQRSVLGVALGVAETVGHDDHAGPGRAPEPAQRVTEDVPDAEHLGLARLGLIGDEPGRLLAVGVGDAVQGEGSVGDADRAAEHPFVARARHDRGHQATGEVERDAAEFSRVSRTERERRHPASLSRGGVRPRRGLPEEVPDQLVDSVGHRPRVTSTVFS